MIEYIVENIEKSNIDETVVVVGHKREVLQDILQDRVSYAYQEEQLGTGHAVLSAESILAHKEGITFILPGDMPLIDYVLINKILSAHQEMGNDLTVVSMMMDYPKSYGRIQSATNTIQFYELLKKTTVTNIKNKLKKLIQVFMLLTIKYYLIP